MTFQVKCSNENYKLLHPYHYPTNHTEAGRPSAGPWIHRIHFFWSPADGHPHGPPVVAIIHKAHGFKGLRSADAVLN